MSAGAITPSHESVLEAGACSRGRRFRSSMIIARSGTVAVRFSGGRAQPGPR